MGLGRSIKASPKRRCEIAVCGLFILFNINPCSACPRQRWFAVLFLPSHGAFYAPRCSPVFGCIEWLGSLVAQRRWEGSFCVFPLFWGRRYPGMECLILESAYHSLLKQRYKETMGSPPPGVYWWNSKKIGLLVLILFKWGKLIVLPFFFSFQPKCGNLLASKVVVFTFYLSRKGKEAESTSQGQWVNMAWTAGQPSLWLKC